MPWVSGLELGWGAPGPLLGVPHLRGLLTLVGAARPTAAHGWKRQTLSVRDDGWARLVRKRSQSRASRDMGRPSTGTQSPWHSPGVSDKSGTRGGSGLIGLMWDEGPSGKDWLRVRGLE